MILDEEHPEELIERERAGLASADELERLNAHLAVCEECRAERTLTRQAQADAAPLAAETRVVARLQRRVAEQRPVVRAAWVTRLKSPTALAVFALTLASGAAAALILERVIRPRPPAGAASPGDLDDAPLIFSANSNPALLPQDEGSHSAAPATPEELLKESDVARGAGQPEKAADYPSAATKEPTIRQLNSTSSP